LKKNQKKFGGIKKSINFALPNLKERKTFFEDIEAKIEVISILEFIHKKMNI